VSLVLLLPDCLGLLVGFAPRGPGSLLLLAVFSLVCGCPVRIPRLVVPPVTAERSPEPLPGLAARVTAVLAWPAAPARICGRQVRAAAQARTPHVTKPAPPP
jgi:hypothetical protein